MAMAVDAVAIGLRETSGTVARGFVDTRAGSCARAP